MHTLAGAVALSAAVKGPWLSDPSTQDDIGGRLHPLFSFNLLCFGFALVSIPWIFMRRYGENPPPIGYTFDTSGSSCSMPPQPLSPSNSLSPLAAAELLRPLALHDDVQPLRRVPGLTSGDARSILCVTAPPPLDLLAVAPPMQTQRHVVTELGCHLIRRRYGA